MDPAEKMDNETLDALKGSIEKWEKIVASTEADDRGRLNCDLCRKFIFGTKGPCSGCPVAEAIGASGCEFTPYIDWLIHQREHEKKDDLLDYHRREGCEECLRLATAERDFLKSLLPETVT